MPVDHASEDEEPSEQAERRRDEIENRLDEIEAGRTEFTSYHRDIVNGALRNRAMNGGWFQAPRN